MRNELGLLLKSIRMLLVSVQHADAVMDEFSSQGIDLTEEQIRQFYYEHGVSMSRRQSQAVKQYVRAMQTIGGRQAFLDAVQKWAPLIGLMKLLAESPLADKCPKNKSSVHAAFKQKLSRKGTDISGGSR